MGVEGKARVGRDRPKKKVFKRKRGYIENSRERNFFGKPR